MRIKEFLFKILFPDYYAEYNSLRYYKATRNSVKKDKYEKVFEAIQRDNVKVIAIEKNKADEWVIVTKDISDSSLCISLYNPAYLTCNHPRIESTLYDIHTPEKKHIGITDVLMMDNNLGNGSICMKYFIQESKNMGFNYIKGDLSSVDKGHFDRSIHFYEKFNFDVKLNEEKTSGSIRLDLKS